jgi:Tol biopolymer transport system component
MINVKTGQTDKIFLLSDYEYNVPEDDTYPLTGFEWSKDGKSFYYLFFKDRLVKHDLKTGEDKVLYKHSDFQPRVLRPSPDGKTLLFGLKYPGDEKSRLFIIPAEGGKEKEVCTAQEAKLFDMALWSPDGKYIFFSETKNATNTSLWSVPAEGGNPQKVWSSENLTEIFDIHPDGNQVAFSVRERATEVRVIENLVQELERLDKTGN